MPFDAYGATIPVSSETRPRDRSKPASHARTRPGPATCAWLCARFLNAFRLLLRLELVLLRWLFAPLLLGSGRLAGLSTLPLRRFDGLRGRLRRMAVGPVPRRREIRSAPPCPIPGDR